MKLFLALFFICSQVWAFDSIAYRKQALGKEIYDTYIYDSDEFLAEEESKGILYTDGSLLGYKKVVEQLCLKYQAEVCPKVMYTKKDIAVAVMYPNHTLVINKENIALLNPVEKQFILGHEFAHSFLKDTYHRSYKISNVLIEENYIITDVDKYLVAAPFFTGIAEYSRSLEDLADNFSAKDLKMRGQTIDCLQMFKKISKEQKVEQELHSPTEMRCNKIMEVL